MAKEETAAPTEAVDFHSLLNGKAAEAERPPSLPAGQYLAVVESHAFDKSSKKKTDFVRFMWKILQPSDDIDASLLEGVKWQNKKQREDFYITPDAIYRLKEMYEQCGIELGGRTFSEVIAESNGLQAWIDISEVPSDDGTQMYNEVVGHAAANA